MSEIIYNCFDSHTHFWATGQVASGLQLNNLKSSEDIRKIKIEKKHYRANWLVGFGWDQNSWPEKTFPNKNILDEVFKDTPVFFTRTDGHASWINSAAILELKKLGFDFNKNIPGGLIGRFSDNELNGLLFDQAHINALLNLPEFTDNQNKDFFQLSQKIFNMAGFTHIRDMSMNLYYWNILLKMENEKSLTICIDAFVTVESLKDLDSVMKEIAIIKENPSRNMRLQGVKIFIDGSLGSRTAYLSESYLNSNQCGLLIWSKDEIKNLLRKVWPMNLQVAIHTIGDQAAQIAVEAAREVSAEGILGRLHLEHVEILRYETIQLMKPLHVTCHLQPCHWLSDSVWIKENISSQLVSNIFQWELLRKNKISFYFGSDSPIEKPSLFNNIRALEQSKNWGIPNLNSDWKQYHSHPDTKWMSSRTEFQNNEIKQVYFNGESLI